MRYRNLSFDILLFSFFLPVSNWILTSCQPHTVISVCFFSLLSKKKKFFKACAIDTKEKQTSGYGSLCFGLINIQSAPDNYILKICPCTPMHNRLPLLLLLLLLFLLLLSLCGGVIVVIFQACQHDEVARTLPLWCHSETRAESVHRGEVR